MNKSKLILISGLPGSGKSTLAEGLAAKLSIPLFSVDPIESSLIRSGLKRSFETGLAAYVVTETLAGEQLNLGMSVLTLPCIECRGFFLQREDLPYDYC